MSMGKMPAVSEIHGQNLVSRFNRGEIDRHVRLGTAMRLNIYMLGPEKLLGAVDCQLFGGIDVLAPAIPPFPGITFGVLVR